MRKTSNIIWQDAQHQVLFEILDSVRDPGEGGEVLDRLQDYTETHFGLEERYMLELGFPDREAHVAAHDRFREEVAQVRAYSGEVDAVFREIIARFLTEWLTRHIDGIDKELERFILDSDAK